MAGLRVTLFGRLQIAGPGLQANEHLSQTKALELLAYLLLHSKQPHARETLTTLLWSDTAPSLGRKYLRKAIWQLQAALSDNFFGPEGRLVNVDDEWLSINPAYDYWLDVDVFDRCYEKVRDLPGTTLSAASLEELRGAVALHTGPLLEGWYQDWCLFERERLQDQYVLMLDKLMVACEAIGEYEHGLQYGVELLRHDRANERTYRQLMRLQYRCGNRTAALQLYSRCVTALKQELGVEPARVTQNLYEQICRDRLDELQRGAPQQQPAEAPAAPRDALLDRVRQLQQSLDHLLGQIQREQIPIADEQAD